MLVEAAVAAQINDQLAPDGVTQADVARAARGLPLAPGMTPTVGDLLLDADTTLLLHGLAAARPALRHAIDAVRQGRPDAPEMLHWLAAACEDATILGDEPTLHELSHQMETAARQHGTLLTLALALSHAGVWGLLAGDLAEARRCFTEMTALAQARDQPWSLGMALLAAWRGQPQQACALLDDVTAEATRQGQGYQLRFASYARCVLELGQGRYDAAYASFPAGIDDTSQLKFALPDLAEAAQRSGRRGAAQAIARQLGELAEASPSPVLAGFWARARALAAGDRPDAEDLVSGSPGPARPLPRTGPPGPQPPCLRRVAPADAAAAGRPRRSPRGPPAADRHRCGRFRRACPRRTGRRRGEPGRPRPPPATAVT